MRAYWKYAQPTSLRDAFRLCKEFAKENRNRSVEGLAELMGEKPNTLYNYMEDGSMPAGKIRGFEEHCGCHYVSRWFAMSAGMMVFAIPRGRAVRAIDVSQLQAVLHTAVGRIIDFAAKKSGAEETLAAIHAGMAGLAWHHGNVEKHEQPELEFGGEA